MAQGADVPKKTIKQAKRADEPGLGDAVRDGKLTAENAAAKRWINGLMNEKKALAEDVNRYARKAERLVSSKGLPAWPMM